MNIKFFDYYKEVKKHQNAKREIVRFPPSMLFCFWISPFVSALAIKKNIKPNIITLMMLPTALIASVLFACDLLICKIIGVLLFHIWFMIDDCDGQVARTTNTYSRYGCELDYLTHQFCHIFFILSICFNIYCLRLDFVYSFNIDYLVLVIALFAIMLFVEYSYRNICSIETAMIYRDKEFLNKQHVFAQNNKEDKNNQVYSRMHILLFKLKRNSIMAIKMIWNCFNCLDNFILLFPVLIIFDICFKTSIFPILTIIFVIASFIHLSFVYIRLLTKAAFSS